MQRVESKTKMMERTVMIMFSRKRDKVVRGEPENFLSQLLCYFVEMIGKRFNFHTKWENIVTNMKNKFKLVTTVKVK
jgi:hypothetical protein